MARGQDNGTTILLGVKDYQVRVVKMSAKGKEKTCPHCGSGRLYGHGTCKPRVFLEPQHRCWKCRDCKRTFAEGGI